MTYGVPYQGSKSKMARQLADLLPGAPALYDVFAGGCAVTHAALLAGKWKDVYANDIDGRGLRLFMDAMDGKYEGEGRWISRDDFKALKDTDPYVALCWSFGSGMREYLYGERIEEYKRLVHEMCFAPTPYERKLRYRAVVRWLCARLGGDGAGEGHGHSAGSYGNLQSLENLERLRRVQGLALIEDPDSLGRLQSLERLERVRRIGKGKEETRLHASFTDYRKLRFRKGSVVYCDPPYRGTGGYAGQSFSHDAFYEWLGRQEELTVVSEFSMPEGFTEVWSRTRQSLMAGAARQRPVTERLYVPSRQLGLWEEMTGRKAAPEAEGR